MQDQRNLKGLKLEREFSSTFHQQGIPFLIDPHVLRSRGCGQVDVIRLVKKRNQSCLELVEIKSRGNLSFQQQKRLRDSATLLGEILKLPVILKFHFDKNY